MGDQDLEELLEKASYQRELAVRRYLQDLVSNLEADLNNRPESAVGDLYFQSKKLDGPKKATKYGTVSKFLSENTDYIKENTNYHIEPDKIRELKAASDTIDHYPTTEEEEQLVIDILDEGGMDFQDLKREFKERVPYEPEDTMIKQRLEKIDEVTNENRIYQKIE
jgi:hypothetical protein